MDLESESKGTQLEDDWRGKQLVIDFALGFEPEGSLPRWLDSPLRQTERIRFAALCAANDWIGRF